MRQSLADVGIPYVVDTKLVRGLDYYSHTCFEFVSSKLGSQSAVLGGGRYDQLADRLGSQSLPAIGWAIGLERAALLISDDHEGVQKVMSRKGRVAVIPVWDKDVPPLFDSI